jgi:hypothetical protein
VECSQHSVEDFVFFADETPKVHAQISQVRADELIFKVRGPF